MEIPKITPEMIAEQKAKVQAQYELDTGNGSIITKYIHSKYPQPKQSSDIADKMYYETVLRASGVKELDKMILGLVSDYTSHKTKKLSTVLKDVPEDIKFAVSRLVKVANRVIWVQACKKAYYEAQGKTIKFPEDFKTV